MLFLSFFSRSCILQVFCVHVCVAILGGKRVEDNRYPYQVSLQRDYTHFCGGSIISKTLVLTAAHCVDNPFIEKQATRIIVVAGAINLLHGGNRYPVQSAIFDENNRTIENDVAILITETIEFNANVKPISLAKSLPPDGTNVILTGWGLISVCCSNYYCLKCSMKLFYLGNPSHTR